MYYFHPCAGVWFLVCSKSLVPRSNSRVSKGRHIAEYLYCWRKEMDVGYFASPVFKLALHQLNTHSLILQCESTLFRLCYAFYPLWAILELKPNVYNLLKVLKLLKSLRRYKYRVRHVTLPCFFVVVVFSPPPVSLLGYHGERERKKKSHIPGENPVYISHLMSCKCYINIFHRVEFKNYHSHKCTYTHKHIYCMYSTCRLLVESHNNSRPTPTCSGFHFTLGIHVDQQQRNKQTKQIRFLPHWHIFRQAGHKSGSMISDLFV